MREVGSARTRLGEFIREFRRTNNLTQGELEKALGYQRAQYVSKLETGKVSRPKHDFLRALAVYTHTPLTELLGMIQEAEDGGVISAPVVAVHENLIDLLKRVVVADVDHITLDDLRFIIDIEHRIVRPLPGLTIKELLEHRQPLDTKSAHANT